MMEEVTINGLAEEMNIKAKDVREALALPKTTAGNTPLSADQIKEVMNSVDSPEAEEEVRDVVATRAPEQVLYFWIGEKNFEFMVKKEGEEHSTIYATKNSVIKLDPVKDQDAIKKLESHPANEENGGSEFKKLDRLFSGVSDEGSKIDKLMEYSHPQLAEMAGGGVENYHKSKGTLIAEIINQK